jgi:D-hexose-6-phosphate mutarotase
MIESLNQRFARDSDDLKVRFRSGPGDIPWLELSNPLGYIELCLQGAHLTRWRTQSGRQVFWMSKKARMQRAKAIRGGVPLCWPWFGAHPEVADFPAHGIARIALWQPVSLRRDASGHAVLELVLDSDQLDDSLQRLWPFASRLTYRIELGASLRLQLTTLNRSDHDLPVSQALHTYFSVGDLASARVSGLEQVEYLDKPSGFTRCPAAGEAIRFDAEVDRIYAAAPDPVTLSDQGNITRIHPEGSRSTVVWNPGEAVAATMDDIPSGGYREFACIETANAADDAVSLAPGASHTLGVIYRTD